MGRRGEDSSRDNGVIVVEVVSEIIQMMGVVEAAIIVVAVLTVSDELVGEMRVELVAAIVLV